MVSLFTFILVLSVLILVHEFGHFWTAKRLGIWVEEFGFGLPPRIFGKKYKDTIYSINLLPFGGFVRLHGENEEGSIKYPQKAFLNKSKKVRSAVITAGVFMNMMLAIVCFSIVYSVSGIPRESENVRIVEIAENSPASMSGLMVGDIVSEINGEAITSSDSFLVKMQENPNMESLLRISRGKEEKEFKVTPRKDYPEGQGPLGVTISTTEIYFPSIWQRPFYGVYYGFQESIYWILAVVAGFSTLFSTLLGGSVPQDIAGPVGIYAITTQAASFGVVALINFVGVLSVNLAVLNIFPFPALDGGRFLFIIIEAISGRRVTPKIEGYIHMAGMALLLTLLVVITFGDIRRLIDAGSVTGFIESFAP
ncbi:site-2 protease family protein [Candidatus Woesebacteria bacterium]|nr:MAG: site-2 protease family protein [Candidatus Woesebacteria bacterium]